ncbi:hypothetical protein TNCV_411601 [Trichonephila clavipes]|nr:hypothetical protein TNCV_411601 [Trichonephila clavipes]
MTLIHGSKLRGPSQKAIVQLNSATLLYTYANCLKWLGKLKISRYVSFVGEFPSIAKHFIKGCVRSLKKSLQLFKSSIADGKSKSFICKSLLIGWMQFKRFCTKNRNAAEGLKSGVLNLCYRQAAET